MTIPECKNKTESCSNSLPLSTPLSLAEHIEYANGAIVSKTLIDKEPGTVTLFSFAANQGLSEHSAPFDALVQILDGKAEIRIGGTPHLVSAGEAILMPANIPHALRAQPQFKMLLTMIKAK